VGCPSHSIHGLRKSPRLNSSTDISLGVDMQLNGQTSMNRSVSPFVGGTPMWGKQGLVESLVGLAGNE
jgi:hypothetical protein